MMNSFKLSYFFLLQIIDLSPRFLCFTVGSRYIILYFTLHSLHFFLYFATLLNHFCEHPDYQCFEFCKGWIGYLFVA